MNNSANNDPFDPIFSTRPCLTFDIRFCETFAYLSPISRDILRQRLLLKLLY